MKEQCGRRHSEFPAKEWEGKILKVKDGDGGLGLVMRNKLKTYFLVLQMTSRVLL